MAQLVEAVVYLRPGLCLGKFLSARVKFMQNTKVIEHSIRALVQHSVNSCQRLTAVLLLLLLLRRELILPVVVV